MSELLVAFPEGQVAPSEQVMDPMLSLAPSETAVRCLVSRVDTHVSGRALDVNRWHEREVQNRLAIHH